MCMCFQNLPSVLLDDDNFFDLLSRYQSRRIDDQRCSFRLTDGASEEDKENTEPQIGYLYLFAGSRPGLFEYVFFFL